MCSVYLVASYLQTEGEIGMTLIKGVSQPWKEIKTIFYVMTNWKHREDQY